MACELTCQAVHFDKQLKDPVLQMEKRTASSLFVNDGSFMKKFKQLQQEQEKGIKLEESTSEPASSESVTPKPVVNQIKLEPKTTTKASSNGKLAFSLKQKSKLVAPPVKLCDEEEDAANNASGDETTKKQKLGQPDALEQSLKQSDVAPPCPSDATVKKVADKLASFVAKNGRQFEHVARQKNPGDTPFKFLFDESCADFKYYEYRLHQEEKALLQSVDSQNRQAGDKVSIIPSSENDFQRSRQQNHSYQIPADALYEAANSRRSVTSTHETSDISAYGESGAAKASDPIAMMEFYAKKAAQEERRRQPKYSKDEMPPPDSLLGGSKKGHHMGDYIPPDELAKFLASCNDVAAQKAAREAAERARIQADNVGHRLLSKMGWKEGEGLGSSRRGIADPIMAGDVKKDHLGVGAVKPGEVTPEDDIYEQYKKRMMLGYKHRPNPLGNPRKAYY